MKPYYDHNGITVYNADCFDVFPMIEDGSVTTIWTDPPYGHDNLGSDLAASRVGVSGGRQKAAETIAGDRPGEWEKMIPEFLVEARRIMREDCCCCCCCHGGGGPTPSFARMALWMDDYLQFFHAVIWDKSGRGHGLGWRFRRNYEFVMVAHKRNGKLAWSDEDRAVPNILNVMPEPNLLHPTTKPLSLVKGFVEWTTKPGDLVVDPFAGSLTTAVACQELGRRCIAVEIEEKYCERGARRLDQQSLPFHDHAAA